MHKFSVSACKYLDFAQSQKNFVRSHGCETVTFRNSGLKGAVLKSSEERQDQKKFVIKLISAAAVPKYLL